MQVTVEDSVITVPDVSTVNLNQVSYYSNLYIMVMILQDHEFECSQSEVPQDTINSGDFSKPIVAPDSGDSSDSSDNNNKVSRYNCGVFCGQFNQVTVESLFLEALSAISDVPSSVSDGGADLKVCQFVVCGQCIKCFRWIQVLIQTPFCSHFKI